MSFFTTKLRGKPGWVAFNNDNDKDDWNPFRAGSTASWSAKHETSPWLRLNIEAHVLKSDSLPDEYWVSLELLGYYPPKTPPPP